MEQWRVLLEDDCDWCFDEIIEAYQQKIYRYIYRMTGSKEEAEDLVQDVFVTVYEKVGQYRRRESFQAWIYRIAKNKTMNRLKRRSKMFSLIEAHQEKVSYEESAFDHNEDYDMVTAWTLEKMKPDQKNLLLLKCVEEMTYREIADIYKLNEATVRKRYQRAKVKFGELYRKAEEVHGYDRCTDQNVF